ncbi:aldo/keto reductase [Sphingobacterium deserti]|uniref:Exported D-threo-aldose 1-dehydrogenase n=1 Tax=Sphingobacterium deserti TaxID=1229276 RepID=A0A0B8T390_9SPHI|nr:aldo/keto reductase [Sphingobacterium deserti]KGE13468.1 exported D-threo-aldose 1-dehydrogenase [Sphingobacterium deserti]
MERRKFLTQAALASASMALAGALPAGLSANTMNKITTQPPALFKRFRPAHKAGFGGVALGNGFQEHSDVACLQTMEAAWNAGIRHYDTSPWYGLGISERRMGMFLKDKAKADFSISTKIGRILEPQENFKADGLLWEGKMNFKYRYDYSASGARKSVEDSLQRLGLSSIDIVYIHDLSPDNGGMKDNWTTYFTEAASGAMKELTKMREEGLIKAWGLGVNTIEPILKTLEVADADIFLSACQYSLIEHEADLYEVFPKVAEKDASIVVGAPLCAGFLAGKDRYLYSGKFPAGVKEKLQAFKQVAKNHAVDLRTAALQFAAAPAVVSAVIPGASSAQQAIENAKSFDIKIPADFWKELKAEKLIAGDAPVPAS